VLYSIIIDDIFTVRVMFLRGLYVYKVNIAWTIMVYLNIDVLRFHWQ